MRAVVVLTLCIAAVSAVPSRLERIVGGTPVSNIESYNSAAVLLRTADLIQPYIQSCGGTIITQRAILTAAQCFEGEDPSRWKVRVGSTNAHSGGDVYFIGLVIAHPDYNGLTRNNDIAILHVSSLITYSATVSNAQIGGYVIPEGESVQSIGWGRTSALGQPSEQLRDVELTISNQASCNRRYTPRPITNQMLCAGWNGGGRGQCTGDAGSPLYHQNIVVGITSFSNACGVGTFPGVYTRVSEFVPWIVANA